MDNNERDFLDLIESCLHLIHDIILNDPMIFSNPNIKNIIVNNITDLISLQIENIENIENYNINYIIKLSMNYYFSYFYIVFDIYIFY